MTPGEDAIETPYGDLWYVEGIHGETIPMYSNADAEIAAIEAYVAGDFGALTSVEINFMREAAKECGLPTL